MDIPQAALESALSLATLLDESIGIAIADRSGRCLASSRTTGADWRFESEARALAEVSALCKMDSTNLGASLDPLLQNSMTARHVATPAGGASRVVCEWSSLTYSVAVRGSSPDVEQACAERAAQMLQASPRNQPQLESRQLRQVMGSFVTGVVVAIAKDPATGRPMGFTASDLVSLSLDPPLVGLAVGMQAASHSSFVQSTHFTVSVLHSDQSALALQLAKSGPDKFAGVELVETADGGWMLADAVATICCRTRNTLRTGDHTLVVGEVCEAKLLGGQKPGLLFFGGGQFGYPKRHAVTAAAQ